ncbi:hypothetical protein PC9H_011655 [Pleurotus ostreatus]|uniref:Uncharacterized protein n=1 Tax=Pleurotus ostreatus TaxID=5322 RepID=A0A8H7DLP2_PLEOS|nr:uncharacterized protein PC9H_011655 [Pleurotus ostreatus]KAF7421135.1 hypothetical protein PC9H_011655 [Pleurotus ostreatus]
MSEICGITAYIAQMTPLMTGGTKDERTMIIAPAAAPIITVTPRAIISTPISILLFVAALLVAPAATELKTEDAALTREVASPATELRNEEAELTAAEAAEEAAEAEADCDASADESSDEAEAELAAVALMR